MALNKVTINDISQFSSNDEIVLALAGKYGKQYATNYQMSIVKNVCFITTTDSCSIDIPDHYKFKYQDESGTHLVDENTNTLTISGMTSLFFHVKNS
jgi:hypothetical protein